MRWAILLCVGLVGVLFVYADYCGERRLLFPNNEIIKGNTPQHAQQQVLRRILDKPCFCNRQEIWYWYSEYGRPINRPHVAYFDAKRKEFCVEVDIGASTAGRRRISSAKPPLP